ncbi:uncharacterized protein LTR77_008026 [Saxophila tyrrhenica]|uniref:Uncharacterized protein n=1 Tax=Saxophila tyrrhenica TaxID=1690608 RepID=A0AAV9P4Z4_9PEZI|nr:hypothetical protein LTR77_008026 [Saxophila tyrrhenica]
MFMATPAVPADIDTDAMSGQRPLMDHATIMICKTLLVEAGKDLANDYNTTVPGYQAAATQDPALRWDVYVNHYKDLARAQKDPKFVYDVDGFDFTRINNQTAVPTGATPKGILYPRAGVLRGCVTHNALIWIEPKDSDWSNIQQMTGDDSWNPTNMRDNHLNSKFYDWQVTMPSDPTILVRDIKLAKHLLGGAAQVGLGFSPVSALTGLGEALLVSPNGGYPGRDSAEGFFQIPLIMNGGERQSVRERIVGTVDSGYPIPIMTNTFVTKINFRPDRKSGKPGAKGVSYPKR